MKKKKILIVEDNADISEELKTVLYRFGYEIVGILSFAEDSVEFVETSRPDIILMDIDLAGEMNGITATEKITARYDIPVIFLTANDDLSTIQKATRTDPYAYILKPFDESILRVNIEMTFYKHKMNIIQKKFHQDIENLHRTADLLVTSKSEADAINFTVQAAKKLCHFDQFAIYKKHFSELDYIAGSFRSSINDNGFKFSKELAEHNSNNLNTYFVSDKSEFPLAPKKPFRFRSAISLKIGKLGVFQIFSEKPRSYTKNEVRLMELLVRHLNEAIKRVSLEREFREQAVKDHLTGCYNRFHLYKVLDEIKKKSKTQPLNIGLLMIDINNLKKINDNRGHLAGDETIRIVASIVTKEVKNSDHVIRYGGDEFLMVLDQYNSNLENIQDRINKRMESWNTNISDFDFPISFAMGGVIWNSIDGKEIEEALGKVDNLMYKNKKKTKKRKLFR